MTPENAVLTYGGRQIQYTIQYRNRKTLGISVHPDLRVSVQAPEGTRLDEIQTKVRKRAKWIVGKLAFFHEYQPRTPPRKYVGGETHKYLGRSYLLKIVEGDEDFVKIKGRNILIGIRGKGTPETVRKALLQWYREKGKTKYAKILEHLSERFPNNGNVVKHLAVREMNTRWGSLSSGGVLTLNRRLIETPSSCIEYVIAHELCHTVHEDHGKAFYRLLSRIIHDWEKRKQRLEKALI